MISGTIAELLASQCDKLSIVVSSDDKGFYFQIPKHEKEGPFESELFAMREAVGRYIQHALNKDEKLQAFLLCRFANEAHTQTTRHQEDWSGYRCSSEGLPTISITTNDSPRKAAELYADQISSARSDRVLRVVVEDEKTSAVKVFEVQVLSNRCIATGE